MKEKWFGQQGMPTNIRNVPEP